MMRHGSARKVSAKADPDNRPGSGRLRLETPAAGPRVRQGDYLVFCIESSRANAEFEVQGPDDRPIGLARQGTAFDGEIRFVIEAGERPFLVGDHFRVRVD